MFLAIFGGIGVLGAWAIGGTIADGWRSRHWSEVPATIVRSEGHEASYTYEFRDRPYSSDRVQTFRLGGSSEIDDWEREMAARLANAGTRPLTAFVNPEKPSEALLDRQIRWKLLALFMPFVFGFGAVGLVAGVMMGSKALGWESRGPWLKPKAREALTQWTVALVWNGISVPLAFAAVPQLWAEGEYFPIVILVIFPLFGMLVLSSALFTTVAVIREGNPFYRPVGLSKKRNREMIDSRAERG